MLPVDKPWYQKLLLLSLMLGAFGGAAALIAVITAHITLSLIQTYVVRVRQVKLQAH